MKYPVRSIQEATAEAATPKIEEQSPEDWKIKMLYDGDCPLCMREVGFKIETQFLSPGDIPNLEVVQSRIVG